MSNTKFNEREAADLYVAYRNHEAKLAELFEKLKDTPFHKVLLDERKAKKQQKKKATKTVKSGGVEKPKPKRNKTPKKTTPAVTGPSSETLW